MKHIKRHILTIVLISIILALILNIKENKNIADDILFLKSIQKNEEEKNQTKQNKIRENQEKNRNTNSMFLGKTRIIIK